MFYNNSKKIFSKKILQLKTFITYTIKSLMFILNN